MAETERITPDMGFVRELKALGGDAVKKCYQCAACGAACPLAPAESPFPRKEMLWAQWGLRARLLGDIDLWLCHNCQTCSAVCPRGARPADVLAAARTAVYRDLVGPAWLGRRLRSPGFLPLLFAFPALLFLVIGAVTTGLRLPEGRIVFDKLYPGDTVIDPLFVLTALWVVLTLALGVKKLWAQFSASVPVTLVIGEHKSKPHVAASLAAVVFGEIASHAKWVACAAADRRKFLGHRALFYGVIALAAVTSLLALGHWGGRLVPFLAPLGGTPMPLGSPIKLLANAGAVAMLYGLTALTRHRVTTDTATSCSSYEDWLLLGLLWAVAVTGLGAEIFRLFGLAALAYSTYFLHLVAVWVLVATLPWSKFGHLVYRTTALVYARQAGRLPVPPREQTVLRL